MLCQYSDVLGKPNQGIHATRLFGLAFWDIFMTLIVALIIAYTMQMSPIKTIIGLFLLAQILHILFCVNTAFLNMIGIKFIKN